MPEFFTEKLLPYKAKDLYQLVCDIKSYPEFLPWVESATILEKNNNNVIAELELNFKGVSGRYTSRVFMDDSLNEISVELAQGPFKHLYNGWKFTEKKEGTLVEFDIDFKMNSRVLEILVAQLFDKACKKTMEAFEKRARAILAEAIG